ncbi:MAG: gas vesicle protein K [Gemmatimonadetes bacterium]|nr:gas vesicle protein K [Gemmatimonadota bacterium]
MSDERERAGEGVRIEADDPAVVVAGLKDLAPALPDRIEARADNIEAGLAKLVLTLLEFIRQILEHQAVRRMEGGTLSDAEIEELGLALLKLKERLDEIKVGVGLGDEDLNIDLGPLGRLL